jgi:tellurite resistance protein TehA-like permease
MNLPPPQENEGFFAQATGMFLFAVGFYGVYHRVVMRHLLLANVLPLHWFYLALLSVGLALLLMVTPRSPFYYKDRRFSLWRAFRVLLALVLWGTLVWITLYR